MQPVVANTSNKVLSSPFDIVGPVKYSEQPMQSISTPIIVKNNDMGRYLTVLD